MILKPGKRHLDPKYKLTSASTQCGHICVLVSNIMLIRLRNRSGHVTIRPVDKISTQNDGFNPKRSLKFQLVPQRLNFKTYLMKIYCNIRLSYSCCIMRFRLCKQPFLIESKHLQRFELDMKENIDIIFMIVKLYGNR